MKRPRSIVSILRVTKTDRPGVEEGDEEDEREVQLAERLETSIMEMFSTKKFTTEEYENDKKI